MVTPPLPCSKAQMPSMVTPATKDHTCPKVLVRGEWRKVVDSHPKNASRQLDRDQQFINKLMKKPVVEPRRACQLNRSPS